jgi:hypothetical protein
MISTHHRKISLTAMRVLVCGMATLTLAQCAGKGVRSDRRYTLPPGAWSLSCTPTWRKGWSSAPLDVFSVTVDAGKEMSVVALGLSNRSQNGISSLRVRWLLSEHGQPDKVIESGETGFIDLIIPPGKSHVLDQQLTSFAVISRPLMEGGVLKGAYEMEVEACEVEYGNGTTWSVGYDRELLAADSQVRVGEHCPGERGIFDGSFRKEASTSPEYSVVDKGLCTVSRCSLVSARTSLKS